MKQIVLLLARRIPFARELFAGWLVHVVGVGE